MSNDRDQEIVTSAITDTGSGLLEFLPSLGQREAHRLRRRRRAAGAHQVRRAAGATACRASTTARFTEQWQKSVGDEGFLEQVVEKWRTSDIGAGGDLGQHPAFLAEGFGPESTAIRCTRAARQPDPRRAGPQQPPRRDSESRGRHPSRSRPAAMASVPRRRAARPTAGPRKDGLPGVPQPQEAAADEKDVPGTALKSLRDRLIQRQQR